MAERDLEIRLKATGAGQVAGEFDRVRVAGKRSMDTIERETKQATAAQGGLAAGLGGVRTAVAGLGLAVVAREVAQFVGGSVGAFADFEAGLIGVAKTADLTEAEVNRLGEAIDNMAFPLRTGRDEMLGIAQAAGQLGVKGVDNIALFTETVVKLGSASNLGGAEAATALARILNVTGEAVGSVDTLASVIVSLGNNFAATEREIARTTTQVALGTASMEIGSAKAAAFGATLAALGVRAELSGTAVGRAFRKIEAAVKGGGEQLAKLEAITGKTGDQLVETFENDATDAFLLFLDGLKRIEDQGGRAAQALEDFGLAGDENAKVLPVLAARVSELRRALELVSDETKDATALNDEFARRLGSLQDTFDKLGTGFGGFTTSLGVLLATPVEPIIRGWANVFEGLRLGIRNFINETDAPGFSENFERLVDARRELAGIEAEIAAGGASIGVSIANEDTAFRLEREIEALTAILQTTKDIAAARREAEDALVLSDVLSARGKTGGGGTVSDDFEDASAGVDLLIGSVRDLGNQLDAVSSDGGLARLGAVQAAQEAEELRASLGKLSETEIAGLSARLAEAGHEGGTFTDQLASALIEAGGLEDAVKQLADAFDEEAKALEREAEARVDAGERLDEFTAGLAFETKIAGLGNDEREIAIALRRAEALAIDAETENIDALLAGIEAEIRAKQELRQATEDAAAAAKEAMRERDAEADRAQRQFERNVQSSTDRIVDFAADAFNDIRTGAIDDIEDIGEAIVDILGRSFSQVTAEAFIRKPAQDFLQSVLGGGSPGFGGGGGSLGFAGGAGGLAGLDAFGAQFGFADPNLVGPFLPGQNAGFLGSGASLSGTLGAAGFGAAGGALLAGLIGSNKTGATIGGGLGAGLGFAVGGPLGGFLGGTAGALLGGLFGNSSKSVGPGSGTNIVFDAVNDNFRLGASGAKGGDVSQTIALASATNEQLNAIIDLIGGDASGLKGTQVGFVGAGGTRSAGFFSGLTPGGDHGVKFDSAEALINSIVPQIIRGGQFEAVGEAVAAAIRNSAADTVAGFADDIAFAQSIDGFEGFNEQLTVAEAAIRALDEQFDSLAGRADALGISTTALEDARSRELLRLTGDFDEAVERSILAFTDPLGLSLAALGDAQAARLREAEALGANLVDIERLAGLERAAVLEQFAEAANGSLERLLDDLTLGGLSGATASATLAGRRAAFETTAASALAGDQAALGDADRVFRDFIEASLGVNASSVAFQDDRDSVRSVVAEILGLGASSNGLLSGFNSTAGVVDQLRINGEDAARTGAALLDDNEALRAEVKRLAAAIETLNADMAGLIAQAA